MNTACKTNKAILFLACRDRRGLWRFPTDDATRSLPGFLVDLDHRTPVYQLMAEKAVSHLGLTEHPLDAVQISHCIEPLLQFSAVEEATLFIGQLASKGFLAPDSWPTLPDVLRKMERNKNRIAYLKALQVLAGSEHDELHAIEIPRKED